VKGIYTDPKVAGGKAVSFSLPGAFTVEGATAPGIADVTFFQLAEDISWVRGAHQIGLGVNYMPDTRLNVSSTLNAQGTAQFTGQQTGLGFGDFMLGRISTWNQARPSVAYFRRNAISLYLQDTWKLNARLTVNAGIRWEPYLAEKEKRGQAPLFDRAAFDKGTHSTVYRSAPAGLFFPGDPGVTDNSLHSGDWIKFAPRFGFAWDPSGDGEMVVRSAYGIYYDFPQLYQYSVLINEPPWGYTLMLPNPPGGLENPWLGYPGGNPFPIALNANTPFPLSGAYVDTGNGNGREVKTAYVHQWNLSIQRQIGQDWMVSGNYLGNSTIHLWNSVERNPAIYITGASCVLGGQTYSPCSSTANTAQRRLLSLANPDQGKYYGSISGTDDSGTRSYNGLLLSIQRRRSEGITVQGNYTFSHCIDNGINFTQQNDGRPITTPRGFTRGNCETDRRHIFNLSTVYETPRFSQEALRILATGWQISGIVSALSGDHLVLTTGIDNQLDGTIVNPHYGEGGQRPNQVLPNPYAPHRTNSQWLNPLAFALPPLGTYGNAGQRAIMGPGSIRFDIGLSRRFQIRESQNVEFRAEAFNVANHVNPSDPIMVLNSSTFGRILAAADPRIIQLALKYVF
jgi:hypothetical protein